MVREGYVIMHHIFTPRFIRASLWKVTRCTSNKALHTICLWLKLLWWDCIWLEPPTLSLTIASLIPYNMLKVIFPCFLFNNHKSGVFITERPTHFPCAGENSSLGSFVGIWHVQAMLSVACIRSSKHMQGTWIRAMNFGLICCAVQQGIIYGW